MAGWGDTGLDVLEGISSIFRGCFIVEIFYPKDVRAERKALRAHRRNNFPPRITAQPNIRRRRVLTLSTDLSSQQALQSQQPQSLILAKLPPEIRQYIWEECLSGMTFHLEFLERKLIQNACASPKPESCDTIYGASGCHGRSASCEGRNLLALLQTCKLVYFETIHVLYAKNKFTVTDSSTVEYLPKLLLTQRFLAITNLSYVRYCGDRGLPQPPTSDHPRPSLAFKEWEMVWQVIASMKGLKKLVVTGNGTIGSWMKLGEVQNAALLEPIKAVTAPQDFELRLPFRCDSSKVPWKDLPCRIGLTEDNLDSWW